MNVHFIIHEAYEGPGAFLTWVKEKGYIATSTKIYKGEPLPTNREFIDLLIILGGPQCPETTIEECHYFDVQAEVEFIKRCITEGKAVVGVCLGAQLIGEALGAKYEKSPNKEIGYFPIELTAFGRNHAKFSDFNKVEVVGHWHNDMPGLTSASKVLADSKGCPRQVVEYSDKVYGFQCHLEFTNESRKQLIQHASNDFIDIESHPFIKSPEDIISYESKSMNVLLFGFLDKLVE